MTVDATTQLVELHLARVPQRFATGVKGTATARKVWTAIVSAYRAGVPTLDGALKEIITTLRAGGHLGDGSVRSIRAAFRLLQDYTPVVERPGRFAWRLRLSDLGAPTPALLDHLAQLESLPRPQPAATTPPPSAPAPAHATAFRVHVHETVAEVGRGSRVISGFPDLASARDYARRRVRDSIESLRAPRQSASDLHAQWAFYGVEARVDGDDWSVDVHRWIREIAGPEDRDWAVMERSLKLTSGEFRLDAE